MTGRELDGGNDDKKPKWCASRVIWAIGVFFIIKFFVFLYINKHFIVSTGYNLHNTWKEESCMVETMTRSPNDMRLMSFGP